MKQYGMSLTLGRELEGIVLPSTPFWRLAYVPQSEDGFREVVCAFSPVPMRCAGWLQNDDYVCLTQKGLEVVKNGRLSLNVKDVGSLDELALLEAKLVPHEERDGYCEAAIPGRTREPNVYANSLIEDVSVGREEITIMYPDKRKLILLTVGADDKFRATHPDLVLKNELLRVDLMGYWLTGRTLHQGGVRLSQAL